MLFLNILERLINVSNDYSNELVNNCDKLIDVFKDTLN